MEALFMSAKVTVAQLVCDFPGFAFPAEDADGELTLGLARANVKLVFFFFCFGLISASRAGPAYSVST